MTGLYNLTVRNSKLYFKDKGAFFSSLITPIILLVLYATFLNKVYRESFVSALPVGVKVADKLIDGTVGAQLFSSLLAVSCITVSFCCNMVMVSDKASGVRADLTVSPVKNSVLSMSYYIATFISSLLVCSVAFLVSLLYLSQVGWFFTLKDILFIFGDIILLVLFGTALSSIINFFLSSQGQISAVGTIVSAGYGFICGAYMPIYSFSENLKKVLMLLPGTYGTSLIRNHSLRGIYEEMKNVGFYSKDIEMIKDSIDCNLYIDGEKVKLITMFLIVFLSVLVLIGVYIFLNLWVKRKKK